jgi:DNA invertase Pin-like site-specific DNA recombinase
MKAVIIARVSTEEQKDAGNSLPAQIARLEKYCKSKEFQIIEQFSFDESAYKTKRNDFDNILDFVWSKRKVPFALISRPHHETFDNE